MPDTTMNQNKYHDFDYELDPEELALLEASENDEFQLAADMEQGIAQLKKTAKSVIHQYLNGALRRT